MFTVLNFLKAGYLDQWTPQNRPVERQFLYRPEWMRQVNMLPGTVRKRGLTRDVSDRGRVFGFAERFARGEPANFLITPAGDAMDPPFKRMRPPNQAVICLRTAKTRTFGFFSAPNIYVAVTMQTVDILKRPRDPESEKWTDPYRIEADKVQRLISQYISPESVDNETDVKDLVTP